MISEYNATEPPAGPNLRPLLFNRALVKGFIISDHLDRMGDFLRDCTRWLQEGKLKYREDIVTGLDAARRLHRPAPGQELWQAARSAVTVAGLTVTTDVHRVTPRRARSPTY